MRFVQLLVHEIFSLEPIFQGMAFPASVLLVERIRFRCDSILLLSLHLRCLLLVRLLLDCPRDLSLLDER